VSIELGSLISKSDKTSLSIRLITWRMEVNDFFSKSLGFVFAWTWNYVILYLWFVNIFACGTAKAINPGKQCTPGSNYMLAIVASILMWQYLPALKMYVVNANSAQVRTKCTECQGEEPQVKQCKECKGTGSEKGLDSHEEILQAAQKFVLMVTNAIAVNIGWLWTNCIAAQIQHFKDTVHDLEETNLYGMASFVTVIGTSVIFYFYAHLEATLKDAEESIVKARDDKKKQEHDKLEKERKVKKAELKGAEPKGLAPLDSKDVVISN